MQRSKLWNLWDAFWCRIFSFEDAQNYDDFDEKWKSFKNLDENCVFQEISLSSYVFWKLWSFFTRREVLKGGFPTCYATVNFINHFPSFKNNC